jgi:hypothetical protein
MRKVVLGMNVSIDGYVASLEGADTWLFRSPDPELDEDILRVLRRFDTWRRLSGHAVPDADSKHQLVQAMLSLSSAGRANSGSASSGKTPRWAGVRAVT